MVKSLGFKRGNLPHWMVADRAYFVTIRLDSTIPQSVLREMKSEREEIEKRFKDRRRIDELLLRQFVRVEKHLDSSSQSRKWLTQSGIPEIMMSSLAWMEARGWEIYAATVMSTHMHILLRNQAGRNGLLLSDMKLFKGYVAMLANRELGRTGTFWAREGFDHWCRDDAKVRGVAKYICENPVKAGLVKDWSAWPWTRCVEWLKPQ